MKRLLVGLAVLALVATACGPLGQGQSGGTQGDWRLVFNDEFDGNTLNGANWMPGWYGSAPVQSQETACYLPEQVVVSDGALHLNVIPKTTSCGGKTRPYASGAVTSRTKHTFTYGYFEARVWLDACGTKLCNWPAWWMDGISPPSWPAHGELDVMEGLSGGAAATWHGPDGQASLGRYGFQPGWHTYAAEWAPGRVTACFDGQCRQPYVSSSNVTSVPQFLIFGMQMSPEGQYGGPVKAPSHMDIDYVRVWQR